MTGNHRADSVSNPNSRIRATGCRIKLRANLPIDWMGLGRVT
jgi:hypothetical protein